MKPGKVVLVPGVPQPMSLRDWFAGLAMREIVGSITSESEYQRLRQHAQDQGKSVSQWIARDAYKQADAMLEARKGGTP